MNLKKLKKTFIVAEIGNNHEGSFNVACKLINEAKKSGVSFLAYRCNLNSKEIKIEKKIKIIDE